MRKQTKLVAVLSASALLAMGASMTSFAATGWTQEDGTWYYYDRDGSRVTDEWKKSGNYWFWLDDDGEMATDMLVEDDDDYYYVDVNGVMVTNRWVAVDNEDAGDEDEPDQYWYYFQSNGKAYKGSDNSSTTKFKTINGKKYAFDDEGRMLYGWVSNDGERQTGDDDWTDAVYYLGDENDGAMSTGWRLISITDDSWDEDDDTFDEDQDRWFYFKSNGKRYENTDTDKEFVTKTINGKKYGFDDNGRMVVEWNVATTVGTQGEATYTREWSYFSSPEDGARKTKGWFKVIPDEDLDSKEYDDAEEYWYYADGNGELYANEIKTINGRKYAFNEYGRMLDSLMLVEFATTTNSSGVEVASTKDIVASYEDDDANYNFETEDDLDATIKKIIEEGDAGHMSFMYFGGEDDGAVKTGKQSIDIDGDKIDFEFNKSGSKKGQGRNEVDKSDKVAYAMGKKYKADSDNKYEVILELENGVLVSLTTEEYVNLITGEPEITYKSNGDEDNKYYLGKDGQTKPTVYDGQDIENTWVVNTSGSLVKTKSKCKDGDDYIIKVDNYVVKEIYEELD
ncbi:cell wall-binding protein [Lachnoclostridium edouardi]|uniref:cell wall-binding protein n=1 Tax=Lachnoclostridium edouardi TaxID=1926283 RepID=UPI000C7C445E|nr:cell wall-binding protein [Lachnoclostridium edouardi]